MFGMSAMYIFTAGQRVGWSQDEKRMFIYCLKDVYCTKGFYLRNGFIRHVAMTKL